MTEQPYTKEQFERDLEARRQKQAEEERAREERQEKETAKRAWLADGGREEDFEKQWITLRDEARRERVKTADQKAREAFRASGSGRI